MRLLLLITIIAGCAKASASAPTVAKGRDFSIPIPAGYAQDTSTPVQGGVVIVQTGAAGFHASVVITPIPMKEVDLAGSSCATYGKAIATNMNVTLTGTSIVDGPTGKTCQMDVVGNADDPQAARLTIVKGSKDAWAVTCNHGRDDVASLDTCRAVLAGWKFD